MILADTSVWADHLRHADPQMTALLESDQIVMHPFVAGELALGHIPKRQEVLESLREMPTVHIADPEEILVLIERRGLIAVGIGYVDTHLLASAMTTEDCELWTRDKRLAAVALRLGISAEPVH